MEAIFNKVRENVAKVMIGKQEVVDLLLACLAAGGHVLLEDVPGTGKTVLAKAMAKSMDFSFQRVQFTPDLLPSDITGLSYFNQEVSKFVFKEGPVFANLLLSDEINRATPRTQAALLECMAENQVTVDGRTRALEHPFFVIATQNPVDTIGCFPLPEAQKDRFLMKIEMGGLNAVQERELIDRFIENEPLEQLTSVCSKEEVLLLQHGCKKVFVHPDLRDYIVSLVQSSRKSSLQSEHAGIEGGVSPRGTLALLRASQGYAMVHGREYIIPEDIKAVAIPVLAHRLLSEDATNEQRATYINGLLNSVNLPTEDWTRP